MRGLLLVLLLAAPGLACRDDPVGPRSRGGILFIGNSLTGENELPEIVEAFYVHQGLAMDVESVVRSGASLEDQWYDASAAGALAQIGRGGWSVVVLQQGPSALPSSRLELVEWTVNYDQRIRAVGARTALFSVWPMNTRMTAFDSVAMSYGLAASEVDGIFLPATQAWLEAWARDPSAPLYSSDGFHPSPAGTYLAAATIFGVLADRSPLALPANIETASGYRIDLAPALADVLKAAAAAAIAAAR
jgi:hypothetical protein